MGSPENERGRVVSEGPQTQVTLSHSYWMGKFEVTQGEYGALMGNNPSIFKPPDFLKNLDHPVENLGWDSAMAYCRKLTEQERAAGYLPDGWDYRLPTEAEWEYACRAGTTTRYSFGDALGCDDECEYCGLLNQYIWWCGNNQPEGTKPVGQKLPNPWGLYDMNGNVGEWCFDWWTNNHSGGRITDPQGPPTGSHRVRRAGSWQHYARYCRSAVRFNRWPSGASFDVGFRVVLASVLK